MSANGLTMISLSRTVGIIHKLRPDSTDHLGIQLRAGRPKRIASVVSCLGVSVIQQFDYLQALAHDLARVWMEFARRADDSLDREPIYHVDIII